MADLVLGVDVGTSAVKLAVIGPDGALIHAFRRGYKLRRPAPGHAEQHPGDWTQAIDAGLAEIAGFGLAPRIAAIGVTSQVNTHVFIDAAGAPLMPAIVWQDGRAAGEAAALEARVTAEDKLRWFGAPIPFDASHPLARMNWLRRHHPALWDRTRLVLLPKDYCLLHLTGEARTDAISNVGLAGEDGFVAEALALVPGAAERLAPIAGPAEIAGYMRPGGPFAGVPVVTATMDGWCALFGCTGPKDGAGGHVSGTSEIPGIAASAVHPTPGVIVFPPLLGLRLHAAPTQAGGAALDWFCGWAGLTPEAATALAAANPRAGLTPLFLPQLQGERAPLWDAALRGAFLGLDASAGLADLARAVMEGVGFAARHAFEAAEASAGIRPERITCGGGGFASPVWTAIKAAIHGRPLVPLKVNEPGILGAAALAAHGAGLFPGLAEAHAALVAHGDPIEPARAEVARYDDLFGLYKEAVAGNARLHAALLAGAGER